MIDAALAQFRVALAISLGRPLPPAALERVVLGLREAREEFGGTARPAETLGPRLEADTVTYLQERRLLQVAGVAGSETPYYAQRFGELGLDPRRLKAAELARLPITGKDDLRRQPDDFVRRGASVFVRAASTGTTGVATPISFSLRELRVSAALQAIDALNSGSMTEADILLMATSGRGLLANVSLAAAAAQVGCLVRAAGVVEPDDCLDLLRERHRLKGKVEQVSILYTYPSYLAELAEAALSRGLGPRDFGLRQVAVGGEIVTQGSLAKARQAFGALEVVSGYGITELWPLGGSRCEADHLHFQPTVGQVSLLDLDEDRPAAPGGIARIVGTPFLPFRESTLLLRYDTQDLVSTLAGPATCSQSHLPASGPLLGKRSHAVALRGGLVFSRDLLEAVESLPQVPLPARVSWAARDGALDLHLTVRDGAAGAAARGAVDAALEARGIPVARIRLLEGQRPHTPFPWRADLKEAASGARFTGATEGT